MMSPPAPDDARVSISPIAVERLHLLRLTAWRFACLYLAVYGVYALVIAMPRGWLRNQWDRASDVMGEWIAHHVLGISYELTSTVDNGSGDTTTQYVQVLALFAVAAVVAAVWSAIARRRHASVLNHRLHTYVRLVLGAVMISYGLAKVFPTQFRPADDLLLARTLGDMSPMGLLWTFMGQSPGYCVFTGAAEVLGGTLLLWRRTATLGALVTIGVLANVVALNFFYDVPVKLFSTHLLLMSVFVLAPDLRRIVEVLVLQRSAPPGAGPVPFRAARLERARPWIKAIVLTACIGWIAHGRITRWLTLDEHPTSDLYGVYEVETFRRDGAECSGRAGDTPQWQRAVISHQEWMKVWRSDGSALRFIVKRDRATGTLELNRNPASPPAPDQKERYVVTYARPDVEHLLLEGDVDGQRLSVLLRRRDMSRSLLVTRGFHWVNEVPFNR